MKNLFGVLHISFLGIACCLSDDWIALEDEEDEEEGEGEEVMRELFAEEEEDEETDIESDGEAVGEVHELF